LCNKGNDLEKNLLIREVKQLKREK